MVAYVSSIAHAIAAARADKVTDINNLYIEIESEERILAKRVIYYLQEHNPGLVLEAIRVEAVRRVHALEQRPWLSVLDSPPVTVTDAATGATFTMSVEDFQDILRDVKSKCDDEDPK